MPQDQPRAPDATAGASRTTDPGEPTAAKGTETPREEVTLDLEDYVLKWFEAQGEDYEALMNQVLRDYIAAEEAAPNQAEPAPDAE